MEFTAIRPITLASSNRLVALRDAYAAGKQGHLARPRARKLSAVRYHLIKAQARQACLFGSRELSTAMCARCGGTGYTTWTHIEDGRCFACNLDAVKQARP